MQADHQGMSISVLNVLTRAHQWQFQGFMFDVDTCEMSRSARISANPARGHAEPLGAVAAMAIARLGSSGICKAREGAYSRFLVLCLL